MSDFSDEYLSILMEEVQKYSCLWNLADREYKNEAIKERKWKIVKMLVEDRMNEENVEIEDMQLTIANLKKTVIHCKSIENLTILDNLGFFRWVAQSYEITKKQKRKKKTLDENKSQNKFMTKRIGLHCLLNLIFLVFYSLLDYGGFFRQNQMFAIVSFGFIGWSVFTFGMNCARLCYLGSSVIVLTMCTDDNIVYTTSKEKKRPDNFFGFCGQVLLSLFPLFPFIYPVSWYGCLHWTDRKKCDYDELRNIPAHWVLATAMICISIVQIIIHSWKRSRPPPKTKYGGFLIVDTISMLPLIFLMFAFFETPHPYLFFSLWIIANNLFVSHTYYFLWQKKSVFFPDFTDVPFTAVTLHNKFALNFVQKFEETSPV